MGEHKVRPYIYVPTIMKLNHLNIAVNDIPATRLFLEKYFGFREAGAVSNSNIAILLDEDGFILTLMRSPGDSKVEYPSSFHLGFIQKSEEKVDEINQRLKDDGFEVKPPRRMHGSWTFYLDAPGGFMVEVLC